MPTIAGVLRHARAEVAPQVPELAAGFVGVHDPLRMSMVEDALVRSIAGQGVDPATVRPEDLNKTERSTISASLVANMRPLLVEGEGEQSRFIHLDQAIARYPYPKLVYRSRLSLPPPEETLYGTVLSALLNKAATQVEDTYTNGKTKQNQWFSPAAQRYRMLGEAMADLATNSSVSREGRDLRDGIRSGGLEVGVRHLSTLVLVGMTEGEAAAEKMQAAHDLSYLTLSLASLNLRSFLNTRNHEGMTLANINMGIAKNTETGRYRLVRKQAEDGNQEPTYWDRVFSRTGAIAATLKCPAHAQINGMQDTSLQAFVPAAVNLLPAYRMLRFNPEDL